MKRLLALFAGALGLRALLRRRGGGPPAVEGLRAKLAETRTGETPAVETSVGETPTDVETPDVQTRRADVHARARQAIDDLGD